MARKLNDQQKIDMVFRYLTGDVSLRSLGREYGITHKAVTEILLYRGVKIRK